MRGVVDVGVEFHSGGRQRVNGDMPAYQATEIKEKTGRGMSVKSKAI